MRKKTKTPEAKSSQKSNDLIPPPKPFRASFIPPSLSSKLTSIKSKISEILRQKEKISKSISKIKIKFKLSQKKEKSLEVLSRSIENRMQNLEKRKTLLKYTKSKNSAKENIFALLKSYLERFKLQDQQKKYLDMQESFLRESDLSFETRSSDSTQVAHGNKKLSQVEALKSAIFNLEEEEENITKYSSLRKYKLESIIELKGSTEKGKLEFQLDLEKFNPVKKSFEAFKQKVLRRKLVIDQIKARHLDMKNELNEIYKRSDCLKIQIANIEGRMAAMINKNELIILCKKVEETEDKVVILKDSVDLRKDRVKIIKEKVKMLDELVSVRNENVKKKIELNEILKEIENEVNDEEIEKNKDWKIRLKNLVELALQKEREVKSIDGLVKTKRLR